MIPDGMPLIALFIEDLRKVLDRYRDQGIMVGEVIGAMELLKIETINDHLRAEDEGNEEGT